MREAKANLSQLVKRAEGGEEIVITRNGTPVVRLTPVPKPNRLATVHGVFKREASEIGDDFDELPDDIAEAFGMKP
jgi:prevent-host-death family protein